MEDVLPTARSPLTSARTLCTLTAQGVYPAMRVVDLRSDGFNHALGKKRWWQLFNIDTCALLSSPNTCT